MGRPYFLDLCERIVVVMRSGMSSHEAKRWSPKFG